MVPYSVAVAAEIRRILRGATDSNFNSSFSDLQEIVDCGIEGCILLLQACINDIKLCDVDAQNSSVELELISAIFRYMLDKAYFSTCLCEVIGNIPVCELVLEDVTSMLKLSLAEKIAVGLALSDSVDPALRLKGQSFSLTQIEELCANPTFSLSNGQIQDIAVFLFRNDGLSKHTDTFTKMLALLNINEMPFIVPTHSKSKDHSTATSLPTRHVELLFSGTEGDDFESVLAEIEKEMSMADIITELGYGSTVDSIRCKEILSSFQPLNDFSISKLIGAISCTYAGLTESPVTYSNMLKAIGDSAIAEKMHLETWDIGVLLDSISELAPDTNWTRVIENLDHEGFNIPDKSAFNLLMAIFSRACQDSFPLHAVCGSVWNNTEGQLSFLKHAVSAPAEVFTFAHCSRQMVFADFVHLKQGNQAWFCLDLLEVLCHLAEIGHASTVRKMLEHPLTLCPDVLLVGLAHINTTYNLLQHEVCSSIFPIILKDPSKINAVSHIWHVNKSLTLRGFVEAQSDEFCMLRIVEICHELKILSAVLDSTCVSFNIRVASLASHKEYLNLESWLNEKISSCGDSFYADCLIFMKMVISSAEDGFADSVVLQSQTTLYAVYNESLPVFFKVLQSHLGRSVSSRIRDDFQELQTLYTAKNGLLGDVAVSSDVRPDAIETEANNYYQQMFSGSLSVDAMVVMLARLRESSDQREQEIFNCMVSNLFEEYKFFPKYPDKQLRLAAVLFGSLIKHQLVNHLALGIALRAVLDALRKSVDSKMFTFGTKALEQFMDRLVEWPQYCNHIMQISHLRGAHPELVSVIERTLARISSSQSETNGGTTLSAEQHVAASLSIDNIEPSEASWQQQLSTSLQLGRQRSPIQVQQKHQSLLGERLKGSAVIVSQNKTTLPNVFQSPATSSSVDINSNRLPSPAPVHLPTTTSSSVSSTGFLRSRNSASSGLPRQTSHITGFGSALNIGTLVAAAEQRDTPIEAPPSDIQDKILFMINNISTSNMESKAKEFNEVLQEQYYPWFAQYMVMKRASIEPNFHDLYLKFLDKVNSKVLNKEIIKATYENCKVLLRTDRIKSSSEERSLLKNLGSWLGKFTIGRNLALRAKEIDPKALIVEAYEKGLMIAVIPFTSKILEPCQSSIAYRPPNPWTMGILSLLAEIYNLPSLKMNLKFDIEVLFKNLGVEMKEVKPTCLLKDRLREIEGNPDFSNKDVPASQSSVVAEVNPTIMTTLNHVELQPEFSTTSRTVAIPNMLNQYTSPVHLPSSNMVDDEKGGPLIMPEPIPSTHGLAQVSPSPTPSPSPSFSAKQLLTGIPRADAYFRINPKLASVSTQMPLNKLCEKAMDEAVREIITPVIQRSVTIASRTTKELILKDYGMESDENTIFRAAHLMVGTLAGSLAHVTCKEPLRLALSTNLRNHIQQLNTSTESSDQITQILVNDHLDLGCAMIESVATRKAVEMIDVEITQSFNQLRKQREVTGSPYFDDLTYAQGPQARIPEILRPKPGQVAANQQRVYEDFITVWQNPNGQKQSAVNSVAISGSNNSTISRVYSPGPVTLNSSNFSSVQVGSYNPSAQSADLTEDSERGSLQLTSISSQSALDSGVQQVGNIGMVLPPYPSNSTVDLSTPEVANAAKDLGAIIPPSHGSVADRLGSVLPEPLTTGDALDRYHQVSQKLEALIDKDARESEIQSIIADIPEILLRCVSRDEAALAVAQKVFKSLYENTSNNVYASWLLAILVAIRDVCKLVVKELTSWVIYSDEEKKFNVEITLGLIRSELLNLGEYNLHLAKLIDGGRNKAATEFAVSLLQMLAGHDSGLSISELHNVMDVLTKIARRPGSPESLQQLIDTARNNANNSPGMPGTREDKVKQVKDKKVLSVRSLGAKDEINANENIISDTVGLQDQVVRLFANWRQICDPPVVNELACSQYVTQLQQSGYLRGDDVTERCFQMLTELAVAHSVSESLLSASQHQQILYSPLDSYAKLVVMILKYPSMGQGSSMIALFPKILAITARMIQKDSEEKKLLFNPRPYFRLFVDWLFDLVSSDINHESVNIQILTSFANAFHQLQPLKVPGWSFAWLELVSHRSFMPKLLKCNPSKGWPLFQRLLVDLFKFMEPYLRNAELQEPIQLLYKGTLRVLLVLLHDFPEFLCEYHFNFCDVIPSSCIQMRNVILSAYPHHMRLPDPSTPNLKIDLLPEIKISPRILSDVDGALKAKQIKVEIDEYLKTKPEGSSFLVDLKQKLLLGQGEVIGGTRYNVPLINSLVLYIGMQAIQQLQLKSASQHASAQQNHGSPLDIFLASSAMDIFQNLINSLDTEGRYLFLNALANQLRYPNNHTHYFSFIILFLFGEANQEIIQEQITRVLLERLIVNRPHPWGLLITFIELIKNTRYSFWERSFTKCAPEIEKLFDSVARSCGGGKGIDEGLVPGGVADGAH